MSSESKKRNYLNVGIMASGEGTNALCIIEHCLENPSLAIRPALIVSDCPTAPVLEKAKAKGIPTLIVEEKNKAIREEIILNEFKKQKIEWVLLAGFMKILSPRFLAQFKWETSTHAEPLYKVVNIHPSLLPHFKGKDAYIRSFKSCFPLAGVSLHLVDEEIDNGQLLNQAIFLKAPNESLDRFISRGKSYEHQLYKSFLNQLSIYRSKDNKKDWTNLKINQPDENMKRHWRIEVEDHYPTRGEQALISLFNKNFRQVRERKVYLLEFPFAVDKAVISFLSREVFCDSVCQNFYIEPIQYNSEDTPSAIEISYKPGVTDNTAHSAHEALQLLGLTASVEVKSCRMYLFYPCTSKQELTKEELITISHRSLGNPLIETFCYYSPQQFKSSERFNMIHSWPKVNLLQNVQNQHSVEIIPLDIHPHELEELSQQRALALNLDEMMTLKNFFADKKNQQIRIQQGLSPWPTDVELEVLGQTWSEHCKHKIFSATIDYQEDCSQTYKLGDKTVKGPFKTFIKGATHNLQKQGKIDWAISVFDDNAGIVRFDDHVDFCIKVETHNSPSALDPYGGALTGILGVNRDILGCGQGARPIANTDIFCFAPPSFKQSDEDGLFQPDSEAYVVAENFPKDLLHPKTILHGVHKGVEDGGNKSGIPTVNGSIFFDPRYAGKPLVFVGTLGAMPPTIPGLGGNGTRPSWKKEPAVNDRVVMIGGLIGADGIHGATYSSLELNENVPATMVQIGDPLTQKRVLDFLMEAQKLGLYSAITDNGAGGLSSSVGEMACFTNGATIDLSLCPLKYPGLRPYEIMISESQERMTLAVPPEYLEKFIQLANDRGVIATDLGYFHDQGHLKVLFNQEIVACLDLDFLHNGLPPMQLKAKWTGPEYQNFLYPKEQILDWYPKQPLKKLNDRCIHDDQKYLDQILKCTLHVLSSLNVASKEALVRQYDHEVQGHNILQPFAATGSGPQNASVLYNGQLGGSPHKGVVLSHGMNPKLSAYDTYIMTQYAVDEACRNAIAVGANPYKMSLVDNFCWPDPIDSSSNPDGKYRLAQLVRSCQALYDMSTIYEMPLVSGKDSMKNNYSGKTPQGKKVKISVPPTLLVSALSDLDHVDDLRTSEFKDVGDSIYLLRPSYLDQTKLGLGGSELSLLYDCKLNKELDKLVTHLNAAENLKLYRHMFNNRSKQLLESIHDISDGGLIIAICESMIGAGLGVRLDISSLKKNYNLQDFFFNECAGQFLVTVSNENELDFKDVFSSFNIVKLGHVTENKELILSSSQDQESKIDLATIIYHWKNQKWTE